MEKKHIALRALLWAVCVYHVTFGLMANAPVETARQLADALLGIRLPADPALTYIVKPFGVYALIFGVMMGVAAWNPVKNRALISVGVVLFALRVLQRLFTLDAMQEAFGITHARNLITIAVVSAFGLALAWLRFQLYREMHAGKTPSSTE